MPRERELYVHIAKDGKYAFCGIIRPVNERPPKTKVTEYITELDRINVCPKCLIGLCKQIMSMLTDINYFNDKTAAEVAKDLR